MPVLWPARGSVCEIFSAPGSHPPPSWQWHVVTCVQGRLFRGLDDGAMASDKAAARGHGLVGDRVLEEVWVDVRSVVASSGDRVAVGLCLCGRAG